MSMLFGLVLLLSGLSGRQVELARYTAPLPAAGDLFASTVALGEKQVLVGAWLSDTACPSDPLCQSGGVHVYERAGLELVWRQLLFPVDGARGDHFGKGLALGAQVAVILAERDGQEEERLSTAFVFEPDSRGNFRERARLHPPAQQSFDNFGSAMAATARTIAIGASGDRIFGYENAGSVHLFERRGEGWSYSLRLVAPVPCPQMNFGASLALDDNWLVVGAPGDPAAGDASGAAFLFRRRGLGWEYHQRLSAPRPNWYDAFGSTVALDGSILALSAPGEDDPQENAGAVYVIERTAEHWALAARLQPTANQAELKFGWDLALSGETLLVSSPLATPHGQASGALWAFRRENDHWTELVQLSAARGQALDFFGQALGLSGELVLAGAAGVDLAGLQSAGALHSFQLPAFAAPHCACAERAPCSNEDPEAGCLNSSGRGARLLAEGSNDLFPPRLILHGRDLPARVRTTLLLGWPGPPLPFGDGLLCLTPSRSALVRLAFKLSSLSGQVRFESQELARLQHLVRPGSTYGFQLWFLDPAGPCGSGNSISQGLLVRF